MSRPEAPLPAKAVPRIVMQAQAMAVLLILLSPSHIDRISRYSASEVLPWGSSVIGQI
jgi:hypothetical protein